PGGVKPSADGVGGGGLPPQRGDFVAGRVGRRRPVVGHGGADAEFVRLGQFEVRLPARLRQPVGLGERLLRLGAPVLELLAEVFELFLEGRLPGGQLLLLPAGGGGGGGGVLLLLLGGLEVGGAAL